MNETNTQPSPAFYITDEPVSAADWKALLSASHPDSAISPDVLEFALSNSTSIGAYIQPHRLIGMVRILGDGIMTHFISDLLVHPEHRHKGVGHILIQSALKMIATKGTAKDGFSTVDLRAEPELEDFYTSCGFKHHMQGFALILVHDPEEDSL